MSCTWSLCTPKALFIADNAIAIVVLYYEPVAVTIVSSNSCSCRGDGAGPAGTAAAGPMLEAKLMNLIKGRLQKF